MSRRRSKAVRVAPRRGEEAGRQPWASRADYTARLDDDSAGADQALRRRLLSQLGTSAGGRWRRRTPLVGLVVVNGLLASPVLEVLGLSGIMTFVLAVALIGVLGWAALWVGSAFRSRLRGIRLALAVAIVAGLPVVVWCLAVLQTSVVTKLFGVQLPGHAVVATTILFAGFNGIAICVAATGAAS